MSVKFTKRIASQILGRGENALKIRPESMEDIRKAITRDDVRKLIESGAIVAVKEKSELHKKAKIEGRKRGTGKRRGSSKARRGRTWEKKVRSQRLLLKRLKLMKKVDNPTFKRYYLLVKGNAFPDKRSLLLHLSDEGIKVSDDEIKQINEYAKSMHT
ncbi:MAG: 50S ribosomal protein L19e [Candidatus Micrarchaeota archaeon]|nr:50S ribosomal protein L19e [Candidatus Micrarchaeota archaeon]